MEHIECLIIGSGPAGYTAAIYTCRADVKTVVYEGMQPGGQLTQTTEIENFPGYPNGVKGPDMMEEIRQQALRFGAEIREGEVTSIDVSQRPFKVTTEYDGELLADSIIVSTGAAARYLGISSEEEFKGGGVSACATCDGFFYKGKDVAVVGGGDTACEDATYLAKLCTRSISSCAVMCYVPPKPCNTACSTRPTLKCCGNTRPRNSLASNKAS